MRTASPTPSPRRPSAWRDAAPLLVILAVFKLLSPPTDVLAPQPAARLLEKLLDPARHLTILRGIAAGFTGVLDLWLLALLAALALVRGAKPRRQDRPVLCLGALLLLAHLGAYYAVYLFSPHDLSVHMGTSFNRLLVQLWPSVLLLVFLAMRHARDHRIDSATL